MFWARSAPAGAKPAPAAPPTNGHTLPRASEPPSGLREALSSPSGPSSSLCGPSTSSPGPSYRLPPWLLSRYDDLLPVERTPTPLEVEHWYISLAALANDALAAAHETATGAAANALVKSMADNNETAKKRVRAERAMTSAITAALRASASDAALDATGTPVAVTPAAAKQALNAVLPFAAPESDATSSVADATFVTAVSSIALESPHDLHRVIARYLMHSARLMPHTAWTPTPPRGGLIALPFVRDAAAVDTPGRGQMSPGGGEGTAWGSPASTGAIRWGASATSSIPAHPDADMPLLDRVRKITETVGNHTTGAKASVMREVFRALHGVHVGDRDADSGMHPARATIRSAPSAGSHAVSSGSNSGASAQQQRSIVGPRVALTDRRVRTHAGSIAATRAAQPVRSQFSVRGLPSQVMPVPKEILAGGSSTRGLTSAAHASAPSMYRGRSYLTSGHSARASARADASAKAARPPALYGGADGSAASISANVVALASEDAPASSSSESVPIPISQGSDGLRRIMERVRSSEDDAFSDTGSLADLHDGEHAPASTSATSSVGGFHTGVEPGTPSSSAAALGLPARARASIASMGSFHTHGTPVDADGHSDTASVTSSRAAMSSSLPVHIPRNLAVNVSERTTSVGSMGSLASSMFAPHLLHHAPSASSVASVGSRTDADARDAVSVRSRPHAASGVSAGGASSRVNSRERLALDAALADFRTFTMLFARGLLAKYPLLNGLPTLRTSHPIMMSPGLLPFTDSSSSHDRSRASSISTAGISSVHVRQISADIQLVLANGGSGPATGDAPVTDTLDCAKLVLRTVQEIFHILLHDTIMPLFQRVHAVADEEWLCALSALRELPPCCFGLSHMFCTPDTPGCSERRESVAGSAVGSIAAALHVYADGLTALRMMPAQTSPLSKVSAVRCAMKCIAISALVEQDMMNPPSPPRDTSRSASPTQTGPAIGADDLLPRLIFILLHASVPRMFSELAYMEECMPNDKGAAEEGYAVTSLRGAAQHLLHMYHTQPPADAEPTGVTAVEAAAGAPVTGREFDDDEDDSSDDEEDASSAAPRELVTAAVAPTVVDA